MCIIAAKKANTAMPTTETIENMWYVNPDGAGFMYAKDGVVHIEKGFMSLDSFLARLERLGKEIDLTAHSLVMHFRITTHGGTKPENCHPFPVSDNLPVLRKLHNKAKLGVAHNGIIPITTRDKTISDTMEYIMSQLAPLHRFAPNFYKNPDAMLLVKNAIQSKMCFMDTSGNLYTVGDFVEDGGMLYSNTSYQSSYKSWRKYNFGAYGSWGDDDWDAWDHYYETTYGKYSSKKDTKKDSKVVALSDIPVLNDCGIYVTQKFLTWLYDIDGYALDENGEMLESEELYIDADNKVWVYDYESDTCFPFPELTAYTAAGSLAHFRYDLADKMYCSVD